MQTVSSTFIANTVASTQNVDYGILISWLETINGSYEFFTIGTSIIGGPDSIKGGGNTATFLDRYQYTDYSNYGISIDINKHLGQYPYGTLMAQAEIKLDNSSLLFTPGHDPTIGNYILPNRPVKLATGLSGETITMFAGYGNPPIDTVKTRELKLTAYDGMNYLNQTVSQGLGPLAQQNNGNYVNAYANAIIEDLLVEAGFSSTDFILEQSLQQPIGFLSPISFMDGTNTSGNEGSIGYIISALCEAELGLAFFDENGCFHFWNRQHIPDNTAPAWVFDFTQSVGGNNTSLISLGTQSTQIINSVTVQATPRAVAANQNIWQMTTPVLIPANSSLVVTASFSDGNGALPVTSLSTLEPNSPSTSNTSNYSVNLAANGSNGTNVASYVTISSVVLSGSTATVTFANSYALPIYVTQMQLYGTPAKVTQTINQSYTNPTSIALYGINPTNDGQTLAINNNLVQDPYTANSICYQIVNDYSVPLQAVQMEVMTVAPLQFGDFVQVYQNDVNTTTDYTITGINFSQTKADPYSQTITAVVKQMITYFTIGTSTIGGTAQIAP